MTIGPRLIIVCGLPGSGKTTRAKQLEQNRRAVRFCPDEWMDALEIDLRDSEARARIENLQWKLAQDLLALGHTVVIEWGTWRGESATPSGLEHEPLALPSNFTSSTIRSMSSLIEFAGGTRSRRP